MSFFMCSHVQWYVFACMMGCLWENNVAIIFLLSFCNCSISMFCLQLYRGVSYTFGYDVITAFLDKHDLDLICRAHQVVEDGYEFQAERKLVTIFSAPNYCGEFDNAGAMMTVSPELTCSFRILRPMSHRAKVAQQNGTSSNTTSSSNLNATLA